MLSSINGILVEEADRLDGDLYERSLHISPWIDLIEVGEWPEELGDLVSTMIYERNLPGSALVWNKVGPADVTPGGGAQNTSIIPPSQTLATGKTLLEYGLEHTALQSEKLNLHDLRSATKRADQLNAIRNMLVDNTNWLWQVSNRSEYARLSSNKVVISTSGVISSATSGVALDANGFPITVSSEVITGDELSNSHLTSFRGKMIRAGAGKNPWDRINGAPLFAVTLDAEVSDAIKQEAGIREDLHYAGRANELLAPLGVDRPYKNYFHITDDLAPRYTQNPSTGAWTEIQPYTSDSATFGTKLIENTAFESAPWTDTIILHKDVMRALFPKPTVSAAAGVSFDPQQYRGLWKWLNVINVDTASTAYNPDGTIGFFRGVFARGSKPIFPQFGYVIRHLRPGFAA